jgi:hypothetical protein
MALKQFLITPAAGKRLIGKAMVKHPSICNVLAKGTLVIVAGTTNGYVAEEILTSLGIDLHFTRRGFFRGISLPPYKPISPTGQATDESGFKGDLILVKGKLQKEQTIFDVVDNLKEGDIILKGANAIDLTNKKAAILIGHPKAGTIGVALQAVAGRRIDLIIPVGVEKRVVSNLDSIAQLLNSPGAKGPRLLPVPGRIFTEIEAISLLTNATAELVSGGGVGGAEGSIRLAVSGTSEEVSYTDTLIQSVKDEPLFEL